MNVHKGKPPIIDNPSSKKLLNGLKGVESLKLLLDLLPDVKKSFPGVDEAFQQLEAVQEQAEVLYLPDKFNELFSEHGWIAYEHLSVDLMREAISVAEQEGTDEAESIIANYYNENTLRWQIKTLWGIEEFRPRLELTELAKEDYLEQRYHACVPLLLAIIDGFVNDLSNVGFFAESSNLTAWDSIAAHSSGLKKIAEIFNAPRKKTTREELALPYRNGIMHGRDLGFGNKLVAAKCWATLFAVRDWAAAIKVGKKEPQQGQEPSLQEALESYKKTKAIEERIHSWKKREIVPGQHWPSCGPAELIPEATPERAVAEFVEEWKQDRYGKTAAFLTDFLQTPINKRAGQIRRDFGHIKPSSYEIIEVVDTTPAITNVRICLEYFKEEKSFKKELSLNVIYQDQKGNAQLRGEEGARWKMNQGGFSEVIL